MKDHELIEELISVRALDGLDEEDERALERAMAEHGRECPECRRLELEYAEVAGTLAFALDPASVPADLEERVMAAATSERAGPAPSVEPARGPDRARRWRPVLAVAAAIVLFAAGLGVGALLVGGGGEVPEGARVVAFEGEAEGRLAVAYRPDGEGVYLLGTDLAAPPEGDVYAVWMLQDGTPVPATCFTPAADGSFFEFVDTSLGTSEAMAVTVEPSSCPSAPTTAPILTAQITA
jgi:anti-sigma-K factor RskA